MTAYYNEIDPFAAAWLKELIKAGHIADGEVDQRSIEDVLPSDLKKFTQCHFFAGIGVWSHALRRAGWSDNRPVWTGSCPCQPFSAAGKGKGTADERHLWPSWFHLINQCRPVTIFGEQVEAALRHGWLDLVQDDMEGIGYACGAVCSPAAGYGAPHIRGRVYFVADAKRTEQSRGITEARRTVRHHEVGDLADTTKLRCKQSWGTTPIALQGERSERSGEYPRPEQGGELSRRPEGLCRNGRRPADDFGSGPQGGLSGREDSQRSYQHGHVGCGGATGSLDSAISKQEHAAAAGGFHSPSSGSGATCDVAFPPSSGRDAQPLSRAICVGGENNSSPDKPSEDVARPTNGFWRYADWLYCRDNKYRPVEPGTFPLAHGAAARVGRLRGYGNAIVAPQAEAFIKAYLAS